MNPLSNLIYFRRSKRRIVPLVLIIILAVIGVSVISIVTSSQLASAKLGWLTPFEDFAIIQASRGAIDPSIPANLAAREDVERVIPFQWAQTRATSLFGRVNVSVLGLSSQDLEWFLTRTDFHLQQGRLPQPDKLEIALEDSIARGRGLEIGDVIGMEVDDREFLSGAWTVVGILDGPVQLAFAPKDSLRSVMVIGDQPGESTYVIFPKPGQMESLDAYISDLPRSQLSPFTYSRMNEVFQTEYSTARMVTWVIDIATVTVLSIATGLLNTIYFMQRMTEFGTLAAIGYKIRFLVRRTLSEAMILTFLSWFIGLVIAQLLIVILNRTTFASTGYSLHSLDAQALLFTLPIPAMIAAFSAVTVIRQFSRLDPLSIIERRD